MRVFARLPIAFLLACTASTSPELQFERRTKTARFVVAELPPMDGIANLWPTRHQLARRRGRHRLDGTDCAPQGLSLRRTVWEDVPPYGGRDFQPDGDGDQ
jgi:hypothetical protein